MQRTESEPSDAVLLTRYRRKRDVASFEVLIDRHETDLLRTAHALLGDAHAAQDAVQEAFLRLNRDADALLARWRPDASLGAWLCTVVRNYCIDWLRRRQGEPMTELADISAASESAPATQVAEAEAGDVLWQVVDGLPALERAAVVLRYRDEMSYQDIAERLDKSVNHVGVLLHNALSRLRESSSLRAGVLP